MPQISNYTSTKNIKIFRLILGIILTIILIFTEIGLWVIGVVILVLAVSAMMIKKRNQEERIKQEENTKQGIIVKIATITVFTIIGAAIVNYFKKK